MIKMKLGEHVGLGPDHIVLDGYPAPTPQKGSRSPQFWDHVYCGQTAAWVHQDATWYGGRNQPRRLCVRWGSSPLDQKGAEPSILPHVYCGQTAAWIKMPLGMEVCLGQDDIVLDGDPASSSKKAAEPPP